MASRFKMLRMKEVTALKDAAENREFLRTGVMKMSLRKTLRLFVLSSWIKYSSFFLCVCVNKTELSSIVSIICCP